jgi:hypothetical protein
LRTTNLQHPSSPSPNIVLAADGSFSGVNTNGFSYAGTVYFTSNGTFVKADPLGTGDIGLKAVRVRCQGAGGAGGGAPATTGGQFGFGAPGMAGSYAESFITDIAGLDATVTVTRGAGGAGVSGATGNNGAASSFGTAVSAAGGKGGSATTDTNTIYFPNFSGFGSSTGDITATGDRGTATGCISQSGFSSVAGGTGGSSRFGAGGHGGRGTGAPATAAAGGTGAGGGGEANQASLTARTGGAGGNGIVIVDCFV